MLRTASSTRTGAGDTDSTYQLSSILSLTDEGRTSATQTEDGYFVLMDEEESPVSVGYSVEPLSSSRARVRVYLIADELEYGVYAGDTTITISSPPPPTRSLARSGQARTDSGDDGQLRISRPDALYRLDADACADDLKHCDARQSEAL